MTSLKVRLLERKRRGDGAEGEGWRKRGYGGTRTDRTGAEHSNLSLLQDVAGHWIEAARGRRGREGEEVGGGED